MTDKLNPGELFPSMALNIAGGEKWTLPDDIASPMALVLFYRGHCDPSVAGCWPPMQSAVKRSRNRVSPFSQAL